MWKDIRTVASALGAPERGDQLVTRLVDRLQAVQARTALGRTRPSIACIEWIDPLMGAGNWVRELVDRAGGTDVLGKAGEHSGGLTIEQLAATDPDVIAIMPCGFDIERSCRKMTHLVSRPLRSRLSAVENRRVVMTDGNQYFNRPGPRVVESAEILETGGLRLRSPRAWLELLNRRCKEAEREGRVACTPGAAGRGGAPRSSRRRPSRPSPRRVPDRADLGEIGVPSSTRSNPRRRGHGAAWSSPRHPRRRQP